MVPLIGDLWSLAIRALFQQSPQFSFARCHDLLTSCATSPTEFSNCHTAGSAAVLAQATYADSASAVLYVLC